MHSPAEAELPKNHRLIYEIVREQGHGRHLPMAEIHALAQARQEGMGFTTVYRALTRLRDIGLVDEITLPGADSAFYELANEPHAHFRCDTCGRIEDIAYEIPLELAADVARRNNIEINAVQISLHGRCSSCRDK
jgi:Fe2+ or Zn2+ uptake regulation protein